MKCNCKPVISANGPGSRSMFVRWRRIAALLNSARSPVSINTIVSELEVHRRTVRRDINLMRDFLDLPIVATPRGLWLSEKVVLCRFCGSRVDRMQRAKQRKISAAVLIR